MGESDRILDVVDTRRSRAAWIRGSVAVLGLVVVVLASAALFRNLRSQPKWAPLPTASGTAGWTTPTRLTAPRQAFTGDGRANFVDMSAQVVRIGWDGTALSVLVTICATNGRQVAASTTQWSLVEYASSSPFYVNGVHGAQPSRTVPPGECVEWNLTFVAVSEYVTVLFTGYNGEVAEWRFSRK